jgi:hypothetical protein
LMYDEWNVPSCSRMIFCDFKVWDKLSNHTVQTAVRFPHL